MPVEDYQKRKHKRVDSPNFGLVEKYGNKANIFADTLDAIEIRDLEIKIENKF